MNLLALLHFFTYFTPALFCAFVFLLYLFISSYINHYCCGCPKCLESTYKQCELLLLLYDYCYYFVSSNGSTITGLIQASSALHQSVKAILFKCHLRSNSLCSNVFETEQDGCA